MSWKLYWEINSVRLWVTNIDINTHKYQYITNIENIKITKNTKAVYFILPLQQKILCDKPLPNLIFPSPFFPSMNKLREWIRDDNLKDTRWNDLGKKDYYIRDAIIIQ